jgi:hypothetical protein
MSRYIEGEGQDRQQATLLPECLGDFIAEDKPVRIVDVFIEEVDLVGLGFDGAKPAALQFQGTIACGSDHRHGAGLALPLLHLRYCSDW